MACSPGRQSTVNCQVLAETNTWQSICDGGLDSHARLVLGHTEADARALPGPAGDLQTVLGAVDAPQPLVDVDQSHAERVVARSMEDLAHHLALHAHAVVVDADTALVAAVFRGDGHAARAHLAADPVADGILHERLQHQHWHDRREDLGIDAVDYVEALAEASLLER